MFSDLRAIAEAHIAAFLAAVEGTYDVVQAVFAALTRSTCAALRNTICAAFSITNDGSIQ
jgi:hypothetical protein